MQQKPTWPPPPLHLVHSSERPPLPPRPGVKRKADVCPKCRGIHFTLEQDTLCRQQAREQP